MRYKSCILLLAVFYISCKKKPVNPQAIKLYKSVMDSYIRSSYTKRGMENAVTGLNKAIKIDTNYFAAYESKFGFELLLKHYQDAILTGKQMVRLSPNNITIRMQMGVVYENSGDKVTAEKYYNQGLSMYNKLLDTMSSDNKMCKEIEFEKVLGLIFLHQEQKGYGLIKDLFNKEPDAGIKQMYQQFMNTSREDLLTGRRDTVTTTSGNAILK